jgi:hypothetical protein
MLDTFKDNDIVVRIEGYAATLANYQEVRIRHFHQTLDKYLND